MGPIIADCHDLSIGNSSPSLFGRDASWQPKGMVTFGVRLHHAMNTKGWDQKTLAEKAGLDPGAVSRHLKRDDAPRSSTVGKYAEALGVSSEWLAFNRGGVYGSGSDRPQQSASVSVGAGALEAVLQTYVWPPEMEVAAMDAICAEARSDALTASGLVRPASIWRAMLDQRVAKHIRRRPHVRGV